MNKNVLDVLVPINPQCPNKKSIKLKCSNCNGDHVASSRDCPKFKDQTKIQADRAKARHKKLQNNLVVRGITFSNKVQNKTEKVQSELTEKIQINKRETELELDNIVQKLEHKVEESFKALSERVVSFMVNSMVEIYEQLDRKNADKVYNILSKESVECFNIKLDPITPTCRPQRQWKRPLRRLIAQNPKTKLRSQTLRDIKQTGSPSPPDPYNPEGSSSLT